LLISLLTGLVLSSVVILVSEEDSFSTRLGVGFAISLPGWLAPRARLEQDAQRPQQDLAQVPPSASSAGRWQQDMAHHCASCRNATGPCTLFWLPFGWEYPLVDALW
jgi:hypothetical protein